MNMLLSKIHLTEKEFKKEVATAMTYTTTLSPIKVKALLYFLYYTGIEERTLLKLSRKEIKESKRNKKILFGCKVQKILDAYYVIEEEQKNAFNIGASAIANFFNSINRFSNKPINMYVLKRSFLINQSKKEEKKSR